MKRLLVLCIFMLYTIPLYAASTSVKIEDKDVSGRKAQVEKFGGSYGLTVMAGKHYTICNKDDDATPNYYGFEAADGSWIIIKETVSAGADVYAYESGTTGYSTGWAARATTNAYQSWGSEM